MKVLIRNGRRSNGAYFPYWISLAGLPFSPCLADLDTPRCPEGTQIYGYTTLWLNNVWTGSSCYSPCHFVVSNNTPYQVEVNDWAPRYFDHWSDGVTTRRHDATTGTGTITNLVAIYR